MPIIEEQLRVGKQTVDRGGARIHTHVAEAPVEEQVTLREEHVKSIVVRLIGSSKMLLE